MRLGGGGPTEADRKRRKLIKKEVKVDEVETGYEIIRIIGGRTNRMS